MSICPKNKLLRLEEISVEQTGKMGAVNLDKVQQVWCSYDAA